MIHQDDVFDAKYRVENHSVWFISNIMASNTGQRTCNGPSKSAQSNFLDLTSHLSKMVMVVIS